MLCPICKKEVTAADDPRAPNPFFPFCSDRCRLVDLGRWLDEKYRIPLGRPPSAATRPDEPAGRSA
ncbi:MAG: DNA gyrase inhibitor YacG [Tepidisphaeraceae bacterium]